VTVVFADLVGFTARSEPLDVEDVGSALHRFHEAMRGEIERYGGVVEFAGDGVMGVFGAPVAHEDDPQRAAHAALAMRESAGALGDDLLLRMGVNTGEVLARVGAIASGESLAGDAINTASRLESAAGPGEILVGEQTYLATRDEIEYEPATPVRAKGKAEPVPCWRAIAARSLLPEDLRDDLPFLGRAAERARLAATFEESARGRTRLLLISGEAGIGKSRLVAELRDIAAETPRLTTWRRGRIAPYGDRSAFGALGEIVAQQAGILASDDAAVAGRKLDAAVDGAGLRGTDAVWVRRHLAPLVGLPTPGGPARREEAMAAWRLFLEAVARRGPAVLVLEDLHHADPALLDFVQDLVEPAPEVGLLVVVTARSELLERRPGWPRAAVAEHLELGPLERPAVEELLQHLADPGAVPPDVARELVDRAGGNPLFARECVRMVVQRGGAPAALPDTVRGIVAARVDALPPAEKAFLQDAAVLGEVAWLGGMAAVGRTEAPEAEALLRRLERRRILQRQRRSSIAGEIEVRFLHGLFRDAAYAGLTREARAPRHERAAEWLERRGADRIDGVELVAHHRWTSFEAHRALGDDVPELRDATRGALRAAAGQASVRHDLRAVVRHAERALTLEPTADDRGELLVLRAAAQGEQADWDEPALLEAREAALAAGRLDDAVRAGYLLAQWAEYAESDAATCDRYLDDALALAGRVAPGPSTTLPFHHRCYRLLSQGDSEGVLRLSAGEIGRARDADAPAALALMQVWHGLASVRLGNPAGVEEIATAHASLERLAHVRAPTAAYNLANALVAFGRLPDAREAVQGAAAWARRMNLVATQRTAAAELAWYAYHAGEVEEAEALLEEAEREPTSALARSTAATVRARLYRLRDPALARAQAEAAVAYGERVENVEQALIGRAALAAACLADGDRQAAADVCHVALAACAAAPPTGDIVVELALVLAVLGRGDEIRAPAAELPPGPWRDAALALADRRYEDAACALDGIPSVPLRDAARQLALAGAAEPRRA
jgi:class 3 adenylate cyclase